jgi:hypothetical protein
LVGHLGSPTTAAAVQGVLGKPSHHCLVPDRRLSFAALTCTPAALPGGISMSAGAYMGMSPGGAAGVVGCCCRCCFVLVVIPVAHQQALHNAVSSCNVLCLEWQVFGCRLLLPGGCWASWVVGGSCRGSSPPGPLVTCCRAQHCCSTPAAPPSAFLLTAISAVPRRHLAVLQVWRSGAADVSPCVAALGAWAKGDGGSLC